MEEIDRIQYLPADVRKTYKQYGIQKNELHIQNKARKLRENTENMYS